MAAPEAGPWRYTNDQGPQGYMQLELRPCPLGPLPLTGFGVYAGLLGTLHSPILFSVSASKLHKLPPPSAG